MRGRHETPRNPHKRAHCTERACDFSDWDHQMMVRHGQTCAQWRAQREAYQEELSRLKDELRQARSFWQ